MEEIRKRIDRLIENIQYGDITRSDMEGELNNILIDLGDLIDRYNEEL